MTLDTVTITGADDHTDVDQMLLWSAMVPQLEWGILLSQTRTGTPRYPSRLWCDTLVHEVFRWRAADQFRLSIHLCGAYARDFLTGGRLVLDEQGPLLALAQRVQINRHGHFTETPYLHGRLQDTGLKKQWILPCNGTERPYLQLVANRCSAVVLHDHSGGRGRETQTWSDPISRPYGYAGGLGPTNLADQLPRIEKAAGSVPFWIDMETGVRDEQNRLSRTLVARVLTACRPYFDNSQPPVCGV